MADENIEKVEIADEVVAIIAGLAATEIEGVAGMSGGIAGGFAEMLGRKNLTKGVEVELEEKEVTVNLYVIIEYGASIPEVAESIQKNVGQAIERMTGLVPKDIFIHVQGVEFMDEEEEKEEEVENE
ncbi:MAG: Asp23/Gls24 family envelope stress response protein [Halanaerobiales bacterium]